MQKPSSSRTKSIIDQIGYLNRGYIEIIKHICNKFNSYTALREEQSSRLPVHLKKRDGR